MNEVEGELQQATCSVSLWLLNNPLKEIISYLKRNLRNGNDQNCCRSAKSRAMLCFVFSYTKKMWQKSEKNYQNWYHQWLLEAYLILYMCMHRGAVTGCTWPETMTKSSVINSAQELPHIPTILMNKLVISVVLICFN